MALSQRLAAQSGADPTLQHEIANVLHTNAGLFREVGRLRRGIGPWRHARDLLIGLGVVPTEPTYDPGGACPSGIGSGIYTA